MSVSRRGSAKEDLCSLERTEKDLSVTSYLDGEQKVTQSCRFLKLKNHFLLLFLLLMPSGSCSEFDSLSVFLSFVLSLRFFISADRYDARLTLGIARQRITFHLPSYFFFNSLSMISQRRRDSIDGHDPFFK